MGTFSYFLTTLKNNQHSAIQLESRKKSKHDRVSLQILYPSIPSNKPDELKTDFK